MSRGRNSWRTGALAAVLIGLGTAGIVSGGEIAPSPDGRPRLRIEQAAFDWGERLAGPAVSHVFELHNDGDAPLVIDRIAPP